VARFPAVAAAAAAGGLSLIESVQALDPPRILCEGYLEILEFFSGVRRPEREAKGWPSSLTEVIMSVSILLLSHTHINTRTLPLTLDVITLV